MKWIRLYEEFQLGDLNFMSPNEIQELFMRECGKETPDLELIKVILDNGLVDVDAEYSEGDSPLHVAVWKNNIALAEYLISAGADVNAEGEWGKSPLHRAIWGDNVAITKLLLSVGADVNAKDYLNRSPLRYAVIKDNKQIKALLKKHGRII